MANKVIYQSDARKKIVNGANKLYDAVKVTLGPKGRNVIIGTDFGAPMIVNDGVTIAKAISLEDPFEDLGAKIIIEAASKTNDQVGDGTTSSIVLTTALINEGITYLDKGYNPVIIRNGLNKYAEKILEDIYKRSDKISSLSDIEKVATISSQSHEVGLLIKQAYELSGADSQIIVEESQGMETKLETVKGYSYDRGFLSSYMATDSLKQTALLDNPLVLITDKKINQMQDLIPHLEQAIKESRPLFIICDEISQEVLTTIVMNKLRGVFNCVITKAPSFGDRKHKILEDIAIITKSTFVENEMSISLNSKEIILGSAKKIIVAKEETTIIDGAQSLDVIEQRIKTIKNELDYTTNEYDATKLRERLAKISGGISIIKVGAVTEVELKEKKLRIEDALSSTKCAMKDGIIEGAGKVFYLISEKLDDYNISQEYNIAKNILKVALKAPFLQIVKNTGLDINNILGRISDDIWFDANNFEFVNLKKVGIIDPTSVLISSLRIAISLSSIFLTTECAITTSNTSVKEDELI